MNKNQRISQVSTVGAVKNLEEQKEILNQLEKRNERLQVATHILAGFATTDNFFGLKKYGMIEYAVDIADRLIQKIDEKTLENE